MGGKKVPIFVVLLNVLFTASGCTGDKEHASINSVAPARDRTVFVDENKIREYVTDLMDHQRREAAFGSSALDLVRFDPHTDSEGFRCIIVRGEVVHPDDLWYLLGRVLNIADENVIVWDLRYPDGRIFGRTNELDFNKLLFQGWSQQGTSRYTW